MFREHTENCRSASAPEAVHSIGIISDPFMIICFRWPPVEYEYREIKTSVEQTQSKEDSNEDY